MTPRDVCDHQGYFLLRQCLPQAIWGDTWGYLWTNTRDSDDGMGQYPLEIRLSERLRAIPLYLNETGILHDILATKRLYLHLPPMARFVFPENHNAAVPAHQDVTYNKHLSSFCVVWVPLVEIDERCGGMAVYPESHKAGELFQGEIPKAGWIPPIDVSGFERLELHPLSPGDIVIMHSHLAHESMPNRSDRTRLSIDFRFFGEDARSTKHYLDLTTRKVIAPKVLADA